jgi:hypothetical protein
MKYGRDKGKSQKKHRYPATERPEPPSEGVKISARLVPQCSLSLLLRLLVGPGSPYWLLACVSSLEAHIPATIAVQQGAKGKL